MQIQIDISATDPRGEAFNMIADILSSPVSFTETEYFNADGPNQNNEDYWYRYTYDFTQQQIDALEIHGWGDVTIDSFDIAGGKNFNDFHIRRVALEASNPVPEPATMLLFGLGLLGLAGVNRRKK